MKFVGAQVRIRTQVYVWHLILALLFCRTVVFYLNSEVQKVSKKLKFFFVPLVAKPNLHWLEAMVFILLRVNADRFHGSSVVCVIECTMQWMYVLLLPS